ncbi:transglycosylase-like protein with SLT domain [Diaminobutyricimonas aerilata]|uniref:Transglycosylase-like protein with SLT domain n=1 Tax=Diaminobutyricimonas aerilata TaxID=1162967 RepID=A0A2M9CIP9_9MICO|nr:transglycosylase SLT domain-containing protein [Diaminobutyricimonas aerilata]PJJ71791.1 transglycosylase-like protein with SLT domain [Diaminobutyricimonas aerilata]
MGRHATVLAPDSRDLRSRGASDRRHSRAAWSLPVFAFGASLAFVLVSIVEPYSGAYASTETTMAPVVDHEPQTVTVAAGAALTVARDGFTATTPEELAAKKAAEAAAKAAAEAAKAAPGKGGGSAPPAGTPDPGTAQAIAHEMVLARGWGEDEYSCLVALWKKESGWNVYAQNRSSGAYGIPQALPGSKMASAGADWQTNPATQITWGLGYIQGRYGTPCGAWSHSQARGWY